MSPLTFRKTKEANGPLLCFIPSCSFQWDCQSSSICAYRIVFNNLSSRLDENRHHKYYTINNILNLIHFVKKALQLHGQGTCLIPMLTPTALLLCDLGKLLQTSLPLFPLLSFICHLLGLWTLQRLNCLLQCVCTAFLIKKVSVILEPANAIAAQIYIKKKSNIPLYRWS